MTSAPLAAFTLLLTSAFAPSVAAQTPPAPRPAEAQSSKSPAAVVKDMTAPENTETQPDGTVAAEGGPAMPVESWTSDCPPINVEVTGAGKAAADCVRPEDPARKSADEGGPKSISPAAGAPARTR